MQKSSSRFNPVIITVLLITVITAIVIVTALLVPQQINPAYDAAVSFVNAAGKGDDADAITYLSVDLQIYVQETCPDSRVSACIEAYIPADWGGFLNAVFRRAQPDGADAWDILLLATYEEAQGFSGVCIYNRAERMSDDSWQITRWAGWVSCDLPDSGLSELAENSNAPNRVPPA
ncbi:MAG: hypothetical protein ACPG7F_01535 [Aggregatilineales bacterium]